MYQIISGYVDYVSLFQVVRLSDYIR